MKTVESCKILCKKDYTVAELKQFAEKIEDDYRVHWLVFFSFFIFLLCFL